MSKLQTSTTIEQATTDIKVENPQKKDGDYQAVVSVSTSLYPQIDEEKLKSFVKGKSINKIRPWLQDFDLGAKYNAERVKAQIKAVYDNGLSSWMLWDPSNKYTPGALMLETLQ